MDNGKFAPPWRTIFPGPQYKNNSRKERSKSNEPCPEAGSQLQKSDLVIQDPNPEAEIGQADNRQSQGDRFNKIAPITEHAFSSASAQAPDHPGPKHSQTCREYDCTNRDGFTLLKLGHPISFPVLRPTADDRNQCDDYSSCREQARARRGKTWPPPGRRDIYP